MKISSELITQIKENVSILEVVGEHVVLRKSGANYSGLCPFHSERSPSFTVNDEKKLYHCYGCKKGGDVITFVMDIAGFSFSEAIEDLADRAKLALPKGFAAEESSEDKQKKKLAHKLNRFVTAYFCQAMKQGKEATDYLVQRKIDPEVLRSYYVGANVGWKGLSEYLQTHQAPLPLAQELGLIRQAQSTWYDTFRNRIVFPIVDLKGKIIGMGGRIYLEDPKAPKYLNSPESFLFQKSKAVFGLYQAQKYIREKDEVIVVEGYFDVLLMVQAGFRNVVATCGTALTLDHLQLLKRFAEKMIVLFDGDEAGKLATEKAMEVGLEAGVILQGAELPSGLDPDELLRTQGAERMAVILEEAYPILDRRVEEAFKSAQIHPEGKVQALKKITAWLEKLKDPLGREVRQELVHSRLGITPKLNGPKLPTPARKAPVSEKIPLQERILLLGILSGHADVVRILGALKPLECEIGQLFDSSAIRGWISSEKLTLEHFLEGKWRNIQWDLLTLDPELRALLTEALFSSPAIPEEFSNVLTKGVSRYWQRHSDRVKRAILEADSHKDKKMQANLMKEYLDVQRKMKDFINFYDKD